MQELTESSKNVMVKGQRRRNNMDKTKVLAEFPEIPDSVDLGIFLFF
jgi:hypothetical protein